MQPAVWKGTIAESDIGETCRGHLELAVVSHHQVLHDAFAGSHDIYRVGGLVGAHAEEMLRRKLAEQVHQLLGFNVVVFYECLHAVFVLLATHMLMGGKVGHNVEAFFFAENAGENRVGEVERVGAILLRHEQAFC